MRVGLDLKDRLTSNLTLDATINPDFGQVEVDPAVLNLSAFETFFPEKRPFFVEGSQVFDFGGFSCNFCSNVEVDERASTRAASGARRRARDLATDNFAFADVPDATTILGAGKITGRTASGYTVGLLDAVTGQANARVQIVDGRARDRRKSNRWPTTSSGGVKRDFMNGNLVVGGIVSGVARNIDTTFAPRLARHAEMYGNDMFYTWDNHMYSLRATAAITNVTRRPARDRSCASSRARATSSGRIAAQRLGRLLLQPLDTTATSLRGVGAYARLAKETGDWFWEMRAQHAHAGLRDERLRVSAARRLHLVHREHRAARGRSRELVSRQSPRSPAAKRRTTTRATSRGAVARVRRRRRRRSSGT